MLLGLPILLARSVRHGRPLVIAQVCDPACAWVAVQEFDAAKLQFALSFLGGIGPATDALNLGAVQEAVRLSRQDGAVLVPAAGLLEPTGADHLPVAVPEALPSREWIEDNRRDYAAIVLPSAADTAYVKEVSAHLPVILRVADRHTERTKQGVAAGTAGILIEDELQRAYTAGLRTALRDREAWNPAAYSAPALQAYRLALRSRIQAIHPSNP